MKNLLYSTDLGKYYLGKCEDTINKLDLKKSSTNTYLPTISTEQ